MVHFLGYPSKSDAMELQMRSLSRRSIVIASLALAAATHRFFPSANAKVTPRLFAFEDTDAFDDAVHKAMKEGFETIDVSLSQAQGRPLAERLKRWMDRIEGSGGEIRVRDVTPKHRGVFNIILAILGIVGPPLIEAARAALRDYADQYHVVLVTYGFDPETMVVKSIEFYKRGSPSWAEAIEKSKPLDRKKP
jgi:hypothetical protein